MRLLYITNGFPFPLTSGYLRHYFLIRELAERHSVTLLSLVKDGFKQEHTEGVSEFTERVMTFPLSRKPRNVLSGALRDFHFLAGNEPGVIKMREAISERLSREEFDAAIFSGKDTVPVLTTLRPLPVVADICDAASVRYRGRLQHARLLERPRLLVGQSLVRRVEQRVIAEAAHVLFASKRDRDALIPNGSVRATVVPNGVDLDFWDRSTQRRGENTIVFTGAMNYRPNFDAALRLIEDILPGVREAVPDAELLIVGRDPTSELMAAGNRPGVTVTGFVDDVRPYLERATVFAAPLRFGAGVQNKVLEAMAMQIPVIASPVAAQGLRTAGGLEPPIEVAQESGEFVEAIVRAFTAATTDRSADRTVRKFVEQHFVWERSGELVQEVLDRVTGNAATARRSPAPAGTY